jgi:sugar phosphate isomerase/epimerase
MQWLIKKIQVSIPFTMLHQTYLDHFLRNRLNPEIGLDATALESFSLSDFNNIAKEFKKQNLSVTLHAPFVDLAPGSTDPSVRALTRHRFEQVLQVVPFFKPKTVVCHSGYEKKRHDYFKETWIENSLEMWSWLGTRLRDEGALLMLENVYEHGPEDLRIFFENLKNHGVRFCLDIGHQAVFSVTSIETWLKQLGAYLAQVHLHDNLGEHDDHMRLGMGHFNFPKFFKLLKSLKKSPPVITLEIHNAPDLWPSFEYLETVWPW